MTSSIYSALECVVKSRRGNITRKDIRVSVRMASRSTVALEIIKHDGRSFVDVTKVHSLTSLLEEQETITDLEQLSRRLMNARRKL
jgi:hypothetical protein